LPVEVAEEVASVSKALTERLTALAVELNDKAVKAAERRVHEVMRSAGEQGEQAKRELADAAETVDDLEAKLDETKAAAEVLEIKLADVQATSHAQAVELAQLRERIAVAEQTARTVGEQYVAELTKAEADKKTAQKDAATAREAAAKLAGQLDALTTQNTALLSAIKPRDVEQSKKV
jgi:colicin import membrane protein